MKRKIFLGYSNKELISKIECFRCKNNVKQVDRESFDKLGVWKAIVVYK